jgi:hypothetical protein
MPVPSQFRQMSGASQKRREPMGCVSAGHAEQAAHRGRSSSRGQSSSSTSTHSTRRAATGLAASATSRSGLAVSRDAVRDAVRIAAAAELGIVLRAMTTCCGRPRLPAYLCALLLRHELGYPSAADKDQRCDQAACPEKPRSWCAEARFRWSGACTATLSGAARAGSNPAWALVRVPA